MGGDQAFTARATGAAEHGDGRVTGVIELHAADAGTLRCGFDAVGHFPFQPALAAAAELCGTQFHVLLREHRLAMDFDDVGDATRVFELALVDE